MLLFGYEKVRSHEKGLYFYDGEFKKILHTGRHWFVDPLNRVKVDVVSQRDPWLDLDELDIIVKSGALKGEAVVLDLKDYERALVWIDGRFNRVLDAGLYALWSNFREIKTEIVDARNVLFEHKDIESILKSEAVEKVLNVFSVEEGHVGVYFKDGDFVKSLPPGKYATWKNVGKVTFYHRDMRETVLDVSGQEIMTADKVTLRMNALVTYRIVDAHKSVVAVNDVGQALYREAQMAIRAAVGTRELETLLSDKNDVATELEALVRRRAMEFGLEIVSLGIRDIILPGEMKTLLNKVLEAKKAAEANMIIRREETAAMRSQVNTAKLMEDNAVLMRLKELEVLERVAGNSKLNVVLGEKGLAERVVNLL